MAAFAYVMANPRGEDVILAAFDALGRDQVAAAAGTRSLQKIRRDCSELTLGLVAQIFGPASTFRGPRRRRSRWAAMVWPDAWTEEFYAVRVELPPATPDRIFFDTDTVRRFIHGDRDAIDLDRLARCKGSHPVSLTTVTALDLVVALTRDALWRDWQARVGRLDEVLDPHAPIFPSMPSVAAPTEQYREWWETLKSAKTTADLVNGRGFTDVAGNPIHLELDPNASGVLDRFKERYLAGLQAVTATSEPQDLDDLIASARLRVELASATAPPGLDLSLRASAHRITRVIKDGKASTTRGNDGPDQAQLQFVEHGIVCTHDRGLHRRARGSGSFDAWRVMFPNELLAWLETAPVPFGAR
jgi:hypothetical protein